MKIYEKLKKIQKGKTFVIIFGKAKSVYMRYRCRKFLLTHPIRDVFCVCSSVCKKKSLKLNRIRPFLCHFEQFLVFTVEHSCRS